MIRFADSFERYKLGSTSDSEVLAGISAYWTSIAFNTVAIVNGVSPNGKCIALGAGVEMFKTLTFEGAWTIAWRYQINPTTTGNLLNQMYVNRCIAMDIISVGTNEDGTVYVKMGVETRIFAGAPRHFNKMYHYELKFELVTGFTFFIKEGATLTLDGDVLQINEFTDIDTGISVDVTPLHDAETNVHAIGASFGTHYLDDFVIYDHNGSHNNAEIGDVKLAGIVPNADTAVKDFTPSTGTAHFSLINIIPPSGDPSSIFDNTVGDKDIWDWQNIGTFTGTIPGVFVSIYARKDDEGSRSFKINCGSAGTDAESPEFFLNDDYIYHHWGLDIDPVTGVAWTVSSFNARQFGVQVES